jgi:undecaprenyl diphosphate synthase
MDGNGRWATGRGLPRRDGHAAGAKVVEKVLAHMKKLGIHHLTLYAFSTENWKRPKEEVDFLFFNGIAFPCSSCNILRIS